MSKIILVLGVSLSFLLFIGCGDEDTKPETTIVDIYKDCNQGRFVDVRQYGAITNDGIDDYGAISQAIEEINRLKGGTLVLHDGVYTIKGHRIDASNQAPSNDIKNFIFKDCNCLSIQGNGAIFDIDGNWTRVADYTHKGVTYSLHNAIGMEFVNCQNVIVKDLELDGNCDKTTREAEAEGKSHGLIVSGSNNVTIERSYVHHYHADGLIINSRTEGNHYIQSKHITVKDSNFTNNARQGCSIIQVRDANFTNCIFSETGKNTGQYGGHSPQAGVDVEPNYHTQSGADDNTGDIIFKNCTFSDNVGFEYVGSNTVSVPYPIRFDSCIFKNSSPDFNSSKYSAVVPSSAKTSFDNCIFDEVALRPNYASDPNAYVNVDVFESSFKSTTPSQSVLFSVGSPNVKLHVEQSTFDFNATESSPGKYRFYLRNAKAILEDNTIFISKEEHIGQGEDVKFLLQKGVKTFVNHWTTDANRTSTYFTISYTESNSTGDTYTPENSFFQRN